MFEEAGSEVRRAQGNALIGLAMLSRVLPRMACRKYASLRGFFLGLAYFFSLPALAMGLGDLQVQSSIGQNLKVAIPLLGQDSEDVLPSCVRGRIFNLDGSFISNAQIQIGYDKRGKNLVASSHQALSEPALSLQITIECGMRIERTWQLLLDMPSENIKPYLTSAERAAIAIPSESKASRKAARAEARLSAQLERALAASKPVAAPEVNSAQSLPSSKSKRKAAKIREGDVLRVSKHSEAELAELHRLVLLMSGALSADSLAKVEAKEAHLAVPQVSAEMRAAQELAGMQQKIRMLEAEANRLQLRSSEQDRQLQGKSTEKNAYFWLLGLGFVLLAALLAIAWLLWRMQQLRQGAESAWHAAALAEAPADTPAVPLAAKAVHAPISAERPPKQPKQPNKQPPAMPTTVSAPSLSPATTLPPSSLQDEHEDFFLANFTPTPLEEMPPIEFARSPNLRDHELEMPTVAEVTDAMHEAEFWMSLGKPEKAAEVLELYSRAEHATSPVTWLYLFELYRSLGEEDKYAQLRTQFQRRFNAQIPAWDDALPDPLEHGIESQQILLSKICMLWGTSQLIAFLEDLIIDNREGMRTGFALPAYRDLLFLLDLAHTIEQTEADHALEFI